MKCSHLPVASQVGKTIVGAIDLNKARMRHVVDALIALSPLPNGFTASNVADRVRALSKQSLSEYGPRHAAYDLKKLRGKQIVRRIGHTRRYEPLPSGLRAMTALLVLRNKAIKPLLRPRNLSAQPWPAQPKTDRPPLPHHKRCHQRRLPRARARRLNIDKSFAGLRPEAPN